MKGIGYAVIGFIAIRALLGMTATPVPQHQDIKDLRQESEKGIVTVSGTVVSKDYYSLQISDGSRTVTVKTAQVSTDIGLINKQISVSGKWNGFQLEAESISLAPTELNVVSPIYRWKKQRDGNSIGYQDRDLVFEVDITRYKGNDCLKLSADVVRNTVIGVDKVPDHFCDKAVL